jgi:multisubunit Na+/H+ antiporter MnhG subunit
MKILRILLHSFTLAIINICSILAGFGVYQLFKSYNQIAIQTPFAALFSIIAFLLWSLIIQRFSLEQLSLHGVKEFVLTFLFALIWSPAIFIPLHYLGRGYLTSFGNIAGLWLFQIPTNFLALLVVRKLQPAPEENYNL